MLNEKEIKVLNQIREDISYENYFFKKAKNPKWFIPLKEEGYFSPDKAPGPKKEEIEEKIYYSIPEWNVLPYLERISEQVNISGNEKYIDELLNIIRDVTNYHIKHDRILDNYITWWYFVKILLNIPNNRIPIDIIELIPIWLDSKFININMLVGSDIATKLLPKFLDSANPDDLEKAEKIIESITTIKWIEVPEEIRGVFGKEEEPKTVIDAHWLLESFKVNAVKIGEKCSENVIFAIAEKLKEIFIREHQENGIDIKCKNNNYVLIIKHLKDFEFVASIGFLKEKPEEQKKGLLMYKPIKIDKIFDFKIRNCKDKKSFIYLIKQEITKDERFKEINDNLDKEIGLLHESIFSDYSYIWFESIFSEPSITIHGAKETLTLILRDVALAKARNNKNTAEKIFEKFLGDEYQYPLFKRIVIFIIGTEWNTFKDKFWQIIDDESGKLLFDSPYFQPEIYTLLGNNISKFTIEEKEKIKTIIEEGPQRYLPEDNQDKYISYWKQKWYSAVKSDSRFKPLYEKYREITQIEEEIRFKEHATWIGPGTSPLTKEEILKMPNRELVEFIKTFKTKDHWKGPTVEGLAALLKVTVQEKPEKFIDDLSPFLNIGYHYIYEMLWGIRDAWNKKKSIDWGKLFEFIKMYIDRDDFWKDKYKIEGDEWPAIHSWITGMIGELIQEGTEDDAWAFSEEHFNIAKEIIFLILDKRQFQKEKEIRDVVSYTLNSPSGKILTALIYLALRIARAEDKKGIEREVKWDLEFRAKYEKALQNKIIEAYTLLGQYMSNLYYLDRDWIEEKIKTILPLEKNEHLWKAFMSGYLFDRRIYKNLYDLMRKDYLTAIDYEFKEGHITERLVQHICIGYLNGYEFLEDDKNLFRKILNKWDFFQIREMIGFFWMQRDYLVETIEKKIKIPSIPENEKIKEKIIAFWRWVCENKYIQVENLNKEDRKILSNLAKLTIFLPKIDSENLKWLMLCALYVYVDFSSPFFIEYLDELTNEKSVNDVGEIFLEMLKTFTPDYNKKHIRSIVEKLYQFGEKEKVNGICNIYGGRGYDFLRDIYEKYN